MTDLSLRTLLIWGLPSLAWASPVILPTTFQNGTVADADQVNGNLQALRDGVNDNDARIQGLQALPHPWSLSGVDVAFLGGRVGIGLTHPEATLHLLSDTDAPRIRFDHTQLVPQVWELAGGLGGFSLSNLTHGRTPFLVDPSARSHSIAIGPDGSVGFGTNDPQADLHVVRGTSPSLRLEQDASAGFTAQAWEWVGSETGLAVHDVTNGGFVPLTIQPGAPSHALVVSTSGNVGLGTDSPGQALHIRGEEASIWVEDPNTHVGARTLMELDNQGPVSLSLRDRHFGTWALQNGDGDFSISRLGSGGLDLVLDQAGNMTIAGFLSENSDARLKEDIVQLRDPLAMLQEMHGYRYTKRRTGRQEVGLLAQEVERALPELVREDAKGMKSVAYANLVALLVEVNHAQQREISALEARVSELEASESEVDLYERLEQLEARMERVDP